MAKSRYNLAFDYAISAPRRRQNVLRAHRYSESSRRGLFEKCARCKEVVPMGGNYLVKGICGPCRAEIIDSPEYDEDRIRYDLRSRPSREPLKDYFRKVYR